MTIELSSRTCRHRKSPRWTAKNSAGYASPVGLAIDVVLLSVCEASLSVVLLGSEEAGAVLPGGFVHEAESAEQAVARHLRDKVGVDTPRRLEQLETFTDPTRDPRGWIPSVAYLALVPPDTDVSGADAFWGNLATGVPRLGYDHNRILELALERIRGKLWWSNIAVGILDGPFTMTEAREVYQAIADRKYDPSTFARDLNATKLIKPTGEHVMTPRGRTAALYRFVSDEPMWGAGRRKRVDGEPSPS